MMGTARNSSLFTLLVVALMLVVSLHAAVFKVNVKQPTEAQRQLHKKWHRAHHLAFAKRSGKMAAAAQKWRQMHPKEAAARMVGAAGDGESAEIDDLDVISTSWNWYNPQGTIKLGIPPQDFIVAFSTISPDTFVSQEGSAIWDNFMSFNANKSYTFSSDNITFQDSLFMNTSWYKCGETPNTGIVGKDLITLGDTLVLPLKFGVVNNLTSQVCMDWNNHDVEGVFGMSLAKSKNPGMAPTLQQIAPILDEPVVSMLTHKVEDKDELEYHMKIGSSHIEGHCSPADYTYFPSTSAFTTPEEQPKADGYNTKLWSVELRYPNGSFAKWNQPAGTSMQFNSLVHTNVYYTDPYIYGDSNTVDELVAQLGGETDWLGYCTLPCNVSAAAPDLILHMGNSTQKVEYVIKPEEYTLPHPWFTGQCLSVLQYHSWYPAWTSSEYHTTNMCFAIKFGAGGDMIGLARPKKG